MRRCLSVYRFLAERKYQSHKKLTGHIKTKTILSIARAHPKSTIISFSVFRKVYFTSQSKTHLTEYIDGI